MPALAIAAMDAPWGILRVAVTGQGVLALEQETGEAEFADRVTRRVARSAASASRTVSAFPAASAAAPAADAEAGARVSRPEAQAEAERLLAHVLARLRAYVAGDGSALADLPIDLRDRPAWDRQVLEAVRGIEAGSTASYGEVARMIGRAGAARAVGGAVGRNPIGLVIPCHRVIAGDGTLGGYGGGWWGGRAAGLQRKRELLSHEGIHVRDSVAKP